MLPVAKRGRDRRAAAARRADRNVLIVVIEVELHRQTGRPATTMADETRCPVTAMDTFAVAYIRQTLTAKTVVDAMRRERFRG